VKANDILPGDFVTWHSKSFSIAITSAVAGDWVRTIDQIEIDNSSSKRFCYVLFSDCMFWAWVTAHDFEIVRE